MSSAGLIQWSRTAQRTGLFKFADGAGKEIRVILNDGRIVSSSMNETLQALSRDPELLSHRWIQPTDITAHLDREKRIAGKVSDARDAASAGRWTEAMEMLQVAEGFLLSRVDGRPSIRDILRISPMQETEALRAFKRLLPARVIDFPRRKATSDSGPIPVPTKRSEREDL